MSPSARPANTRSSRRTPWRGWGGCLGYVLAVVVLGNVSGVIQRQLGFPCTLVYYLLVACFIALLQVHRIRRRGQTIPEAMAASRTERRRLAEARKRARHAAAALPWLRDRRLSPDTVPGVLITPAQDIPGYHPTGYDVVLDSSGAQQLVAVRQVMRLTRLSPRDARNLVENAPVTVLRVPDLLMAEAARDILQLGGATVSITAPNS
jgi:hypothetical protein